MLPEDIHRLIFDFTYNKRNITSKKFNNECTLIEQIKHCIPQEFFQSTVYSLVEKEMVSNPYREFMPYIPLTSLQHRTILKPWVTETLWGLSNKFFARVHSYRTTFRRYLYRLNVYGIRKHWNKIYLKYLVHITSDDFATPAPVDIPLVTTLVSNLEEADCF